MPFWALVLAELTFVYSYKDVLMTDHYTNQRCSVFNETACPVCTFHPAGKQTHQFHSKEHTNEMVNPTGSNLLEYAGIIRLESKFVVLFQTPSSIRWPLECAVVLRVLQNSNSIYWKVIFGIQVEGGLNSYYLLKWSTKTRFASRIWPWCSSQDKSRLWLHAFCSKKQIKLIINQQKSFHKINSTYKGYTF